MRKTLLLFASIFAFGASARAQAPQQSVLTAVSAACTTANTAGQIVFPIRVNTVNDTSTVGVSISGTFTATLVAQLSGDFGLTWPTTLTAPVAGTQTYSVAGNTNLCVRVSAFTSGSVNVTIVPSSGVVSAAAGSTTNLTQIGGTNVATGGVAGSLGVGGLAAADSATSGNPVLIGGVDFAGNVQELPVSDAGSVPAPVQVLQIGGIDTSGNTKALVINSNGSIGVAKQIAGFDGLSNAASFGFLTDGFGDNLSLSVLPSLFNGTTWDRQNKCPNHTSIVNGAAGTQQLVAPVAGQKIYICAIFLAESVAGTIQLTSGTGATCGTGTTTFMAATTLALGQAFSQSSPSSYMNTSVGGDGLCLVNGAGTVDAGVISWAQY